jgi:hypothetical protein
MSGMKFACGWCFTFTSLKENTNQNRLRFLAGTNPEERTEITHKTQLLLSKIKLFGLMVISLANCYHIIPPFLISNSGKIKTWLILKYQYSRYCLNTSCIYAFPFFVRIESEAEPDKFFFEIMFLPILSKEIICSLLANPKPLSQLKKANSGVSGFSKSLLHKYRL